MGTHPFRGRFCFWGDAVGRGRLTSAETVETIRATYSLTGSIADTSRNLGVPESTVRKYIDPKTKDEFAEVRAEKIAEAIPSIVEMCAQAQRAFLTTMMSEEKLKNADFSQIAIAFGVVTDKALLLTGQATSRTETIAADPIDRLSAEELEQMVALRSKLVSDGAPV